MLEKEAHRNVINFDKENCKVTNFWWNYLRHEYTLVANRLKSILAEEDLGFLVGTKLNL